MKKKYIILLLALAVIFAGAGVYLKQAPTVWIKSDYCDYYNQGKFEDVITYSQDFWLKSLALTQIGYTIGSQAFDESFSAESRLKIARYAVEVFKEAVFLDPNNEEAKYNLELLISKLPEINKKMQEEVAAGGEEKEGGPDYAPGGGNRGY